MQKQFNINFFGLSETWLNGSVSNDAFGVPAWLLSLSSIG